MKLKRNEDGFDHVFLVILVIVIAAIGLVVWRVFKKQSGSPGSGSQSAGVQLSNGKCSGTGPGQLTHAAMNPSDFLYIIPYGLMTGGHVTPIDHQYYTVERSSVRNAYPVYAMGDAHIVDIEHRTSSPGDNQYAKTHSRDEWRLVFSHSCTFFYYYDLMTSLAPDLKSQFDTASHGGMSAAVDITVKAGDEVGRIGGQTLDFAVWDTQKQLSGFVLPDHYKEESWKIYVADPLDYYSSALKSIMLSRYPRVDQPLSGKIDWDIDGKLRGNWFIKGTAYEDHTSPEPWSNQLSFAPDLYDHTHFIISIGNYGPGPQPGVNAQQYYASGSAPDPASVSPHTGLIKYELTTGSYIKPNGNEWHDFDGLVQDLKVKQGDQVYGTVLVLMTDDRTLKFESFPGKGASQISGFTSAAKTYTR